MIENTLDFAKFKFREDNRAKIDYSHVDRLVRSIKQKNLLRFRPILVNSDFEVIDGQHRLLAAKALNTEIFYEVQETLQPEDIINLNISQKWCQSDYLNYYVKHEYEDYINLQKFMNQEELSLRVSLGILGYTSYEQHHKFRLGQFRFDHNKLTLDYSCCKETIATIKRINGYSSYTSSSRFWKAMLSLIQHPEFDPERWLNNVGKLTSRFCAMATIKDYKSAMIKVYNYGHGAKIYADPNFVEV